MSDRSADQRESFSKKLVDILNFGALNLAMGIGYRAGLFDVMDRLATPCPADEIARAAGVDSRYVREWLGVMVCGGVVTLITDETGEDLFQLPAAYADLITRRAGSANLGVYTQEIPLLTACAWEAVFNGLRTGEGISYQNYPHFQRFMGQLADAKHSQVLVDLFLPSVDEGRIVAQMRKGIRVCDLGCAEGVALMLMAKAFPKSEFVGIDIATEALATARAEAEVEGLVNVSFWERDAAFLDADPHLAAYFDYVTAFDAIHDQTSPGKALAGVYAILKPGGAFSMVDIAASSRLAENLEHPMGPFLYTVSLMHCMPVGLTDGGEGLGMMWGRQKAMAMLAAAGFGEVEVCEIPRDAFNLHFFSRKGF